MTRLNDRVFFIWLNSVDRSRQFRELAFVNKIQVGLKERAIYRNIQKRKRNGRSFEKEGEEAKQGRKRETKKERN